ncbi:hypothetical protein EVAR_22973_1 [Eumeta japonica]|uniref:Uncharacterized protein n=1 Tax=Eumeta variegata TaxID=151549 RepID=A0A4C1UQL0_EUMVA|nr:hypothetical protein EVAR_22973_1 [Eumeta japonica]
MIIQKEKNHEDYLATRQHPQKNQIFMEKTQAVYLAYDIESTSCFGRRTRHNPPRQVKEWTRRSRGTRARRCHGALLTICEGDLSVNRVSRALSRRVTPLELRPESD